MNALSISSVKRIELKCIYAVEERIIIYTEGYNIRVYMWPDNEIEQQNLFTELNACNKMSGRNA